MPRVRKFAGLGPSQGLLAGFALTILLPGLLLFGFGLRSLSQESNLARQQLREQLDIAAEAAMRETERQLLHWEATQQPPPAEEGLAARVVIEDGRVEVTPPGQLAYQVAPVQQRSAGTATELNTEARKFRSAGQFRQALEAYQKLASSTASVGSLPASLVGQYEICSLLAEHDRPSELRTAALDLYESLVSGRWHIEKPRYFFYSEAARQWLANTGLDTALEDRKLALTAAIESALRDASFTGRRLAGDPAYLVLARRSRSRVSILAVAESHLRSQVFPRILSPVTAQRLEVSARASSSARNGGMVATRNLAELGLPWTLTVSPRDPAALQAATSRQRNFYLTASLLGLAVMTFGGYSTIRAMRRELEIARMKADFAATVSHEFRSPLTGIRQLGEMLMRGRVRSEEKKQQYYEMITRESDRLARLVENVLDFSRIEEGRKNYSLHPLEPAAWLRGIAGDFQIEAAARGISLAASIPRELPVILADREALTSSVHNLLDNAFKYSAGSDTVWLDAETNGALVSIRVRDHGVGIAPEDREHIFEKFYRGKGEETRQVKGAGLGLSLVKHIVTAHGGTVGFESRQGEGTTFCIQLPVAQT